MTHGIIRLELLRRGWSQKSQGIWLFPEEDEVVVWDDHRGWGWGKMGCILGWCKGVVTRPKSETGVYTQKHLGQLITPRRAPNTTLGNWNTRLKTKDSRISSVLLVRVQ